MDSTLDQAGTAATRSQQGKIIGVTGNLITVDFSGSVIQGEVAYVITPEAKLKSEVLRISGKTADLQVFEDTTGLRVGDIVDFTGELLVAELGPGLLGKVFDGLQNPLPELAEASGTFLQRGVEMPALSRTSRWQFNPVAGVGDRLLGGDPIGTVTEGVFSHSIMVPFHVNQRCTVRQISGPGAFAVDDTIAILELGNGSELEVSMCQRWPVKLPVMQYAERLRARDPLVTQVRIIDTLFPVARGGTYCIPGPFGAGKTVLAQLMSRHAEVDIVVIAACGERAGEVVETLREFPEIEDPLTGRSLMERTVIICNTSSMPVAARETSVYMAVTIAEYYRQMGLHVLLLADSTSRWAQSLRETSGRLEEIPGEEAFPAYLESVIASFYERGGLVRLRDGSTGSVTIGGTVSPAGGNFEEPVTQSTLKVAGAFLGLSRERSDARRYPAIDPLESWSKYDGVVPVEQVDNAKKILRNGHEIGQMMKVVGEEGTSLDEFIEFLKAEFLDAVYLQQDAFHEVDSATPADRQSHVFEKITSILTTELGFHDKDRARFFFQNLTQSAKDWNRVSMEEEEFKAIESQIDELVAEACLDA